MTEQSWKKVDRIKIELEMASDQAWALAQFLKRISFGEYNMFSTDKYHAWQAMYAGEAIREALAAAGVDPR